MDVVRIAWGLFCLTLISPAILSWMGVDPFIVALAPLIGFLITGMICAPGTARLIVGVARKLEEEE